MNYNDYQLFTRTTAQYPKDAALNYTALGFLGELGEISNKFKKVIRGDYNIETIRESLIGELGDVYWYLARHADERDCELDWVFNVIDEDYVGGFYNEQLFTDALLDIFKDFNQSLEDTDYLRQVAGGLYDICTMLGTTSEEVMLANKAKLEDRVKRNVIKGSGDNR